jgi:hypothetical protein
MKYWADQGFQWHHPHAPPEKPVAPVVQETILRLAHRLMKREAKRMHATLLLFEYDDFGSVSATDVGKLF